MDGVVLRRLREQDLDAFRAFCYDNWPGEHPLIHNEAMFNYYYRDEDGGLNFAVAQDKAGGDFYGVCGYIKANSTTAPDVWISYILTKKGAPMGLGFKLLEKIQELTGCRTLACNNIRSKTRGLYEFMGWQVADMTQYYRLNEEVENYTLCNIKAKNTEMVPETDLIIEKITTPQQLEDIDLETFSQDKPYKDQHYAQKRFLRNPWLQYDLYTARQQGEAARAVLVVRRFTQGSASALRVVDYIGQRDWIPRWGGFLDRLMKEQGADFIDWFALGLDDDVMRRAGFVPLLPGDDNIIPLYLSPPVLENVTLTCFTSDADGYVMFRADGDQDRPNLG